MTTAKLNSIVKSMACNRPFFSEADFQHSLALALESNGCVVNLEYPVMIENRICHIDIIVEDNGVLYPIELKYKTKAMTCTGLFGIHLLRCHRAYDINRYLFWKDVSRLENLKRSLKEKISEGYVIMLTNDENYWQESKSSKNIDQLFRIHHSTNPANTVKDVSWINKNKQPFDYKAGAVVYKCFSLNNIYTVSKWTDYSRVIDLDSHKFFDFKFLIMTIR